MYNFRKLVVGLAALAMAVGIAQGAPKHKKEPCTTYPPYCPQDLCALYYNECGEPYGGCFLDPICGGKWPDYTPPPCPYGYTPYSDYDPSGSPYTTYVYGDPGYPTPTPYYEPPYSYPPNPYPTDPYPTDPYPSDPYPSGGYYPPKKTPCNEDPYE